ncbi:MAG: UDP-3-O-[3-hydroxymyristoyl] N-acetylglucosamine deacetylase, partial [Nonlabens sp.]
MKQHTIKKSVSVKGVGLHTGEKVKLTFKPAPENHGFKFQRIDLESKPVITADVNKVVSTNRGTTLQSGEATISTVEHVLSALMGLHIDNVLIEIDGPEAPIMDGSAMPFLKSLEKAGIEEQANEREYFTITEPISYRDEESGAELIALPASDFQITTMIDFNSDILGHQYASLDSMDDYKKEIAASRTFVFLRELEFLLDQNLIKGGDLDNAIVIADKAMGQRKLDALAKRLNKPKMKIDKGGILNTTKLHFENEPARHKLLDIIGDIALIGKPIKGRIVATKPGHTANIEFAKLLKKNLVEQRKLKGMPKYDPTAEPLFDTVAIQKMLPHRFPFVMVDKIFELSETHVAGIKNITFNESFFQGHFPGNPVFPGVLQMEALAQTGGILALSTVPDPENWDTYFLKIDNAKFKAKVAPGDALILKMELLSPIRRGIIHMKGTAYVGNRIVSSGELTA